MGQQINYGKAANPYRFQLRSVGKELDTQGDLISM